MVENGFPWIVVPQAALQMPLSSGFPWIVVPQAALQMPLNSGAAQQTNITNAAQHIFSL
jgi:hypothetical protein